MAVRVTEGGWVPPVGSLPEMVDGETVYVVPLRPPAEGSSNPRYTDTVRYLPKLARARNVPVEFATPSGSREYLSEYAISPETWSLGLACLQMANDWLIEAVTLFIAHRADSQGWTPEEADRLPLKVTLTETSSGRTYQIEGEGVEVLEALKELQRGRDGGAAESGE